MAPVARFQGRASHHSFMVEGPKVLLPSSQEIKWMNSADRNERLHYFVSVFVVLYLVILTAGSAVMVLGPILKGCINRTFPYHGLDQSEPPGLSIGFQRVLVAVAFSLTVAACTAACLFAMQTGRLSKVSGLDWELFAVLLAFGGMSLLLQCFFAVCWLPVNERFGYFTFAEATFTGLTPFVSDAFDTLKDTIFSALCFESKHTTLKIVGVISWLYLLALHVFLVRRVNTLAELVAAYLPVLTAPPKAKPAKDAGIGESSCTKAWNMVLFLMYKQATPTKRELLLWENVPQALLSIVYLYLEGGSRFIATINVAIPTAQIVAAFLFFPILLRCVAPTLAKKLLFTMQHGDYLKADSLFSEAFEEEEDLQLFIAALPILRDEPLINDLMTKLDITWKDVESRRELLPGVRTGLAAMIKCEGDLERVVQTVEDLQAAEAARFPNIFEAAQSMFGLGATRHFVRTEKGSVQETDGVPRFSALHCAAGSGFGATCEVLLGARAEVDARTLDGETPLHWAAEKGHPEAVKCLLEWKASMIVKNGSGKTPLGEAKINHHRDIVDLLEAEEHVEETRKARDARPAWEAEESQNEAQNEAVKGTWNPFGGLKLKEKLFGSRSG
eukprot:s631_g9.t1